MCETLYYHCIDNSKYIYDLHRALEETGFNEVQLSDYIIDSPREKNMTKMKLSKKREKAFLKIHLMLMQLIVMICLIKIGLYMMIIMERQKKNGL